MSRDPDPRLVEIWKEIGEAIASGDIQGLFVVWEYGDRDLPSGRACRTDDPDRLLAEVRDHAIRLKTKNLH